MCILHFKKVADGGSVVTDLSKPRRIVARVSAWPERNISSRHPLTQTHIAAIIGFLDIMDENKNREAKRKAQGREPGKPRKPRTHKTL